MQENFCPLRRTLGAKEKNTDLKLNYCHVILHRSKEKFAAAGL